MTTLKSYQIEDNLTIRGILSTSHINNSYMHVKIGDLGSVISNLEPKGILITKDSTQIAHLDSLGNAWLKQDMHIDGNLYVAGTQTIINTTVMQISDNIMTLNTDVTGTPTEDAGIEVERGTSPNTSILWSEANKYWVLNNGTSTYRIVHDQYNANFTLSKDAPVVTINDTGGKGLKLTVDNNVVTINNMTSDVATIDLTSGLYSNADKVDGLHSTSFVRTDAATTMSSTLTISGTLALTGDITANSLTVSPVELSMLDNVTGNIQTQLNGKAPTNHAVNAATYGYGDTVSAGHVRIGDGISVTNGTISAKLGPGLQLNDTKQISVVYGTAANTACQGNDSRLHTHNKFRKQYIVPTGGILQNTAVTLPDGTNYTGSTMFVIVDGVFQHINIDYTESSPTTVTFLYDMPENSVIEFVGV